jgi:hypothetical protein
LWRSRIAARVLAQTRLGLPQDFLFMSGVLRSSSGPSSYRAIESDVVIPSWKPPRALGITGAAAVVSGLLAMAPSWLALSCAVASAAGWCWWLEQLDAEQPTRGASAVQGPARLLDGRSHFGRATQATGARLGTADDRGNSRAGIAAR